MNKVTCKCGNIILNNSVIDFILAKKFIITDNPVVGICDKCNAILFMRDSDVVDFPAIGIPDWIVFRECKSDNIIEFNFIVNFPSSLRPKGYLSMQIKYEPFVGTVLCQKDFDNAYRGAMDAIYSEIEAFLKSGVK